MEMLGLQGQVTIQLGDGNHLPYPHDHFDGAICQHVTMNIEDRDRFFTEAYRVLKPGGFFVLTKHGLGPNGVPHHPLPWSEDGTNAYLKTPVETMIHLENAGFEGIEIVMTGLKYAETYYHAIGLMESKTAPIIGMHVLIGKGAVEKMRNARRNTLEERTQPAQIFCRKPL